MIVVDISRCKCEIGEILMSFRRRCRRLRARIATACRRPESPTRFLLMLRGELFAEPIGARASSIRDPAKVMYQSGNRAGASASTISEPNIKGQ